ncbi:MAG: hypothetical protein Q4B72_12335 [Lachnospiraceae bacterium]|nr:hypothetical protein [Lachnospiraceae bacterium]
MSNIIFQGGKIKIYQSLVLLAEYAGLDQKFADKLWSEFLCHENLYHAYTHYMQFHNLDESLKVEGYSLIDLYVWQMNQDNLFHDVGRNTGDCNKEKMVLQSFWMMARLIQDPLNVAKKLQTGDGMDTI